MFSFPLKRWIMLALIVGSALFGSLMSPRLPMRLVTHWGFDNQPNGWMSRSVALAFIPVLMTIIYFILLAVPGMEPDKQRQKKLRDMMEGFGILFLVFLFYVHVITILWNMIGPFDLARWLLPGFAVLLFGMSYFFKGSIPNRFFGIRTPWTLKDERVWKETHRIGSYAFKVAALITLVGILFPQLAFLFLFIPIVGASLGCVLASYLVYRRLHPHS